MWPGIVAAFSCLSHRLHTSLSFYKETLAGDTDNYVHIRARMERKQASVVLGELVEENLQSLHKAKQIASVQPSLVDMCVSHCMVNVSTPLSRELPY